VDPAAKGIAAYDLPERVAAYDADMELMHPNRGRMVEVVLSTFALHHLTADEKRALLRRVASALRAGGWFVNADLVVSEWPELEERIQALRVAGIVGRAAGRDPRFTDAGATRAWLDEMEAREGDQPLPLARDLALAREAGLHVEVFWKEHREAVWGGPAGKGGA